MVGRKEKRRQRHGTIHKQYIMYLAKIKNRRGRRPKQYIIKFAPKSKVIHKTTTDKRLDNKIDSPKARRSLQAKKMQTIYIKAMDIIQKPKTKAQKPEKNSQPEVPILNSI